MRVLDNRSLWLLGKVINIPILSCCVNPDIVMSIDKGGMEVLSCSGCGILVGDIDSVVLEWDRVMRVNSRGGGGYS